MKKTVILILLLLVSLSILIWQVYEKPTHTKVESSEILSEQIGNTGEYWFLLHRKSNIEYLYQGTPGVATESALVKTMTVKTGIPGERPTPLPQLLGREYWLVIAEFETFDSIETAPYFLTLDIPYSEYYPYGPTPYLECEGQCDWELPGSFGLHGVAGDPTKITGDNLGSSGCIRHTDADITYLYNLLDPQTQPIRYYIEDI